MTQPPSKTVGTEELLAHAGFIRSLARALVSGDADVDDVVQETWLAALGADFSEVRRPKSWLASLVRRRAARHHRTKIRADQKLERAPPPALIPEPPTLAMRHEGIQRVSAALSTLPLHERDAVVLRYYDDLSPRASAKRLGVPVETVRTRVRRGLEHLRRRLDTDASQSGRDWHALLLPLAWPSGAAAAATGGLAVGKFVWTVGGLLALVLVGLLVWRPWAAEPGERGAGVAINTASEAVGPTLVGRAEAARPSAATPASVHDRRDAVDRPVFPALHRPAARIEGLVRDVARAAVAGAEVELRSTSLPQFEFNRIGDDRAVHRVAPTDAEGRFHFDNVPAGPYILSARRDDDRSPWLVVAARPVPTVVELVFQEARNLEPYALRVVDADGSGVSGAQVEVTAASDGRAALNGEPEPLHWSLVSASDGRVPWPEYPAQYVLAFARTGDGRVGTAILDLRGHIRRPRDIPKGNIVVREGGGIGGTVRTRDGEALEGAWVEAHLRTGAHAYWTALSKHWRVPVVAARYEHTGLPAGRYELVVGGKGWQRALEWREDGRYPVVPPVEVETGSRTRADLTAVRGGAVEGRVSSAEGPLAGAWIRVVRDPRTTNDPDGVHLEGVNVWRFDYPYGTPPEHPVTHRHATTDSQGHYRIDGLEPGIYRVEMGGDRYALEQRLDVEIAQAKSTDVSVVLERAGVLQGMAPGVSYFGARRVGEEHFRSMAILGTHGLFTFAGLPAGDYELASAYWGWETVVLGTARVEAGRTTWVDLTNAGEHALTGRLFVGGTPLSGAPYGFGWWGTDLTKADGRFEVRWLRTNERADAYFQVRRPLPGGGDQIWRVRHPALQRATGVTEAGDIELGAHGLHVVVAETNGDPVPAGLAVRMLAPDEGRSVSVSVNTRTDPAGRVDLDGLPGTARYVVEARLASGLVLRDEVDVPTLETVRLIAPSTGRLEIIVIDHEGKRAARTSVHVYSWIGDGEAPEDLDAWLSEGNSRMLRAVSDEAGQAILDAVPAGTLHVHASQPETWRGRFENQVFYAAAGEKRIVLSAGETRALEIHIP